jgi:ABC-2 type transport system permease protein
LAEALVEPVAAKAGRRGEESNPCPWQAAWTLCRREWVRFVRQKNRLIGAIGQPLLFWLLFGAGLGPSFRMGGSVGGVAAGSATASAAAATNGISFIQYFFPGTLVLILLFTAIFATISVIEDRREGFLQSVLVAPIPRWSMVLGKLVGGTLIAVAQAAIFLLLGYTLGLELGPLVLLAVVAWMFIVALGLTGLGFVLAWRTDSVQGFHALMSVLLLPMWLLSGAFFPASPGWLGWIVRLNPLTYGVAGLRRLLYLNSPAEVQAAALANLPAAWLCGLVTVVFCVLMFALSWRISAGRTTGDLL